MDTDTGTDTTDPSSLDLYSDPDTPAQSGDRPGTAASALVLVGFVALAQLAGAIGVPFTDTAAGGWYDGLEKPFFQPPNWLFAPMWIVLYTVIAVAAWRIWRSPAYTEREQAARSNALTWWGIQLVLNAAWTPMFFGARAVWAAFIVILMLWVAVMMTISAFRRVDEPAAWLMAPYAAWITFAAGLNGAIAGLN